MDLLTSISPMLLDFDWSKQWPEIIIPVIVVVIIIFAIVTTITGKKASKKEKKKRKLEVRNVIKKYMADEEDRHNIRIDFEKVYARKGSEYKYRDVFDVIVDVYEPKTNKIIDSRAYEVEGITMKVDKKNYKTNWRVNNALDLKDTKRRIAIAEKEIKLSKEEKQVLKREEKVAERKAREKRKEEMHAAKAKSRAGKHDKTSSRKATTTGKKFVPTRNKD